MSRSMLKDRQFLKTLVTLMLPMVAQNLITLAAQMMDSLMLGRLDRSSCPPHRWQISRFSSSIC